LAVFWGQLEASHPSGQSLNECSVANFVPRIRVHVGTPLAEILRSKNDRSLAVCMQLFSELLQCRDDQFPQRVAMLERLHEAWTFDQLVPMTRSSSEADSEDATFGRDSLHSPSGYYIVVITLFVFFIYFNRNMFYVFFLECLYFS